MTDVSSQNPYRTIRSSARTSPSIEPANSTSSPSKPAVARRRWGEVAAPVGEHEHADAGDEHDHQRGEAVEPQVEVDAELGDPLARGRVHLAVDDAREQGHEPDGRGQRGEGGEGEHARPDPCAQRPGAGHHGQADHQVQGEQDDHEGRPLARGGRPESRSIVPGHLSERGPEGAVGPDRRKMAA